MGREIAVDARHRPCPVPILELALAVRRAEEGDVVLLSATDPGTWDDVVAWCEATGHRLLGRARDGAILNAWVLKSSSKP